MEVLATGLLRWRPVGYQIHTKFQEHVSLSLIFRQQSGLFGSLAGSSSCFALSAAPGPWFLPPESDKQGAIVFPMCT